MAMIEAGVAGLEVRHRGPDQPHGVHEVDVEAGQPVLLGVRDRQRADVGHHDVEPAERLRGLRHPRRQRVAVTDVEHRARGGTALLHGLLRVGDLVGTAGAEADDGALVEKAGDDGTSDAAGSPGDEDTVAGELEVHGGLPF